MGWSGLLSPTTRTGMPLYDLSCFKERQGQNERDSAIRQGTAGEKKVGKGWGRASPP